MVKTSNITVTDARLKRALKKGVDLSSSKSLDTLSDELQSNLSINEAKITRWYLGIDKVMISLNGNDVIASLNYLYIDKDMIISATPEGSLKTEDSTGYSYIEPSTEIYVNVLSYNTDNEGNKQYSVVGYINNNNGTTTHDSNSGEILLQCGENKISITKDRINIIAPQLFINGLAYDDTTAYDTNKDLSKNYYTKTECDVRYERKTT